MKRKFLYLLLTLCLLGQCLPAFAAQAPVLERIAFSGATIVGQFKSDVYQYQLVLDNAAVSPKLKSYKVQGEGNLFVTYDTDSTNHQTAVVVTLSYDTGSAKYTFTYKNAAAYVKNSENHLDSITCTLGELEPDNQEALIHAFSDNELREVLDELYLDDTVDMIEEMPATVVKRILRNTDVETRASINTLLRYPEDSAGSIMTPEFVDLKRDMTVEDAFKRIRRTGVDKETIYTCYVTDASRHLLGVTTVKELLLHDQDDRIEAFMETNVIYVNTLSDQEEAAAQLSKYDFLALPVVDLEERLVGIITVDDAMDVIQEENTEDIQKMNAIVPTERTYLKTGVLATWKSRIPWLLLLMVSATFTGSIITSFEDKLASMIILTSFIPMLMDTGGNSGGQASVTVIRALSLNEIDMRDIFKVIWKELRVGLLCGTSTALRCTTTN